MDLWQRWLLLSKCKLFFCWATFGALLMKGSSRVWEERGPYVFLPAGDKNNTSEIDFITLRTSMATSALNQDDALGSISWFGSLSRCVLCLLSQRGQTLSMPPWSTSLIHVACLVGIMSFCVFSGWPGLGGYDLMWRRLCAPESEREWWHNKQRRRESELFMPRFNDAIRMQRRRERGAWQLCISQLGEVWRLRHNELLSLPSSSVCSPWRQKHTTARSAVWAEHTRQTEYWFDLLLLNTALQFDVQRRWKWRTEAASKVWNSLGFQFFTFHNLTTETSAKVVVRTSDEGLQTFCLLLIHNHWWKEKNRKPIWSLIFFVNVLKNTGSSIFLSVGPSVPAAFVCVCHSLFATSAADVI